MEFPASSAPPAPPMPLPPKAWRSPYVTPSPFFKKDIFEIFRKHSDMAFLVFTHGGLIDEALKGA